MSDDHAALVDEQRFHHLLKKEIDRLVRGPLRKN